MLNSLTPDVLKWLQPNQSPGKILRKLREKYRLTQQDLGASLGCSDNIVSRIERDEQQFRNVGEVVGFTEALGCTEIEKSKLIEAFLYAHAKISLWIASRLLLECPDNPVYQKAFQAALETVLQEEVFTQERKDRKNQQAKKRRLQPALHKMTIMLITTALTAGFFMAHFAFQSAHSSISTSGPTTTELEIPIFTPQILFEDDFEAGHLEQWENRNSIGRIVRDGDNHILRLENTSDDFVIFLLPHRPWTNYAVEASVRIEQSTPTNTDFFINIRTNGDGSYSAGLDMETSTTNILAASNGTFADLGTKTIGLTMNQWLQLRIEAVGNQIALYIDEELMRSATSSDHAAGTISFSIAPHTIVELDNVRVVDLASDS